MTTPEDQIRAHIEALTEELRFDPSPPPQLRRRWASDSNGDENNGLGLRPRFHRVFLLKTRLRGADSRNLIQGRLSGTEAREVVWSLPKVLELSKYRRLTKQLAQRIVENFSVAIGTPFSTS